MKLTHSTAENPPPELKSLPQLPAWPDTPDAPELRRILDETEARLRQCGHLVQHVAESRNFRWLVEYAAAYVREAWIAADGQNADSTAGVFLRCERGRHAVEWASQKAAAAAAEGGQ